MNDSFDNRMDESIGNIVEDEEQITNKLPDDSIVDMRETKYDKDRKRVDRRQSFKTKERSQIYEKMQLSNKSRKQRDHQRGK